MKASYLIGRVIFGGFFLYSGIHHLQETEAMAQYAGSKGVPLPALAVKGTGVALIVNQHVANNGQFPYASRNDTLKSVGGKDLLDDELVAVFHEPRLLVIRLAPGAALARRLILPRADSARASVVLKG